MMLVGSDRYDRRGFLRTCGDPCCPDPYCMVRCGECGGLERHDRGCEARRA